MDASTTGSAQHKIKTINVEVNLLEAWAVQRVDLEAKVVRKALLLAAILVASVLIIPVLATVGTDNTVGLRQAKANLETSYKRRDELEAQAKTVTPSIERDVLVTQCHLYSNEVRDELATVINAADDSIFFEEMTVEANGGELTIKVAADATSPETGRTFVAKAGKGSNVISSTQTSIKQTSLTATSIRFDYIKRVTIGK